MFIYDIKTFIANNILDEWELNLEYLILAVIILHCILQGLVTIIRSRFLYVMLRRVILSEALIFRVTSEYRPAISIKGNLQYICEFASIIDKKTLVIFFFVCFHYKFTERTSQPKSRAMSSLRQLYHWERRGSVGSVCCCRQMQWLIDPNNVLIIV